MLVFFNAGSFENQVTSVYHAGELLRTMMATVESLKAIGNRRPLMYRDSEIRDRRITSDRTFKEIVDEQYRQIKDEEKDYIRQQEDAGQLPEPPDTQVRFSLFISHITQSPLASEEFADEQFECTCDDQDVSFTAVGYAAHFTRRVLEGIGNAAVVVSLSNHPRYSEPQLMVLYAKDNQIEERLVWNVVYPQQVTARRLQYDPNSKHPPDAEISDFVSAMDLNTTEAQYLLDHAVELEGERRVFARHKGYIYIFPRHLERNEHNPESQSLYHGFRVGSSRTMRSKMVRVCNQLFDLLRWEELRP